MSTRQIPVRKAKRPITEFSDIGGDFALNLVNTRPIGPDGPIERLAALSDVLRWCVQFGAISLSSARRLKSRDGHAVTRSVRELREALRSALEAEHQGRPKWRPLIDNINAVLARSPRVGKLVLESGELSLRFDPRQIELSDIPALVAERIASFIAGPDAHLVRPCGAEDCVLWFVDRTRNRSRHWCRMESCGARAKARAYYRRNQANGKAS